jgi:endonuclease/exonuclease/phosphatase (EEP) superfamily protein YafD
MRNAQLEGLSAVLRDDGNRARILVADLNITPWSPRYDVIESQTGLRNAARSLGYLGTWPASPALLRIPIDHCLVSDSFAVQHVEVGPDIGSDHLPLIVDISIAGPPDRRT